MGFGWRKAFCTTIQKHGDSNNSLPKQEKSNPTTPKLRFNFFSSSSSTPSTPRLVSSPRLRCRTPPPPVVLTDLSPKLQCKISERVSNESSPRSPSTFSLLRSINALRISKHKRCGLCLYSVKSGQGTAIFTAECGHTFHFPCVASHVRKEGLLMCPVCNSQWTDLPPASVNNAGNNLQPEEERKTELSPSLLSPRTPVYDKQSCGSNTLCNLKVYNDDEPLMSPKSGGLFNPIQECDEINEDNDDIVGEFQGFFPDRNSSQLERSPGNLDIVMMPDAAVVSVNRGGQTCVIALKIIAPPAPTNITRRAPIDLVAVIDVSMNISKEKIQLMKKIMKLVVCSMTAADRLSIVAFSTMSKRLLPLKRMTATGRRTAHRIINAIVPLDGASTLTAKDALKKAVKVIEDRRERNPASSILLLSNSIKNDDQQSQLLSTTRLPNLEIPIHKISLTKASECCQAPSSDEDYLGKYVERLMCLVVQDLRIQLGIIYGSAPGEIAGVYSSSTGGAIGIGSGLIRLGDMYAKEEREILIELKVPSMSSVGDHRLLSVRTTLIDPSTQKLIQGKEQAHLIPIPLTVRSPSNPSIERLKRRFIITRAIAESRRLVHKNDLAGAYQMLSTARALLLQTRGGAAGSGDEFLRSLEVELSELQKKRQKIQGIRHSHVDEKLSEPLTPTSAWRAAERLAKVAMMRKSLNRVSDLHGFENARF